MHVWKAIGIVFLFAAAAGCDKEDAAERAAPPAPVASVAKALGVDAGELEAKVDPPALAGDLKAEVDAFTTVDACVEQHAKLDPLVGDALEAIGYDTILRDACIVLDAAKAKDAKRCQAVDASSLEARCEATVAEVAGEPDACPFLVPTRPERGHDAACLALASRDARLCAGALDPSARMTCEAIAVHDAAPCKKLALRADQDRCTRDEKRMATAIPAAEAASGWANAPTGKATLGDAAIPVDTSRGVVVLDRIDGARFTVGAFSETGPSFIVPSPNAGGTVGMEIVAPADAKKAHVERIDVEQPGKPATHVDGTKAAALTVRVTKLEKRRGGAVELTVDGPIDEGVKFHAEVTTFVRDIVKPSAMLVPGRFGDAGFMR